MTKGRVDSHKKTNEGKGENAPSVIAGMETFKIGAEDLGDALLPRIPNEVTLQVIAPKLSRKDINVLTLVSPTWNEAIYNRSVYDARVRSNSTETLLLCFTKGWNISLPAYDLCLYCLNDGSRYDLPPVPCKSFQYGYKFIPLDGKIYILGGIMLGLDDSPEYSPPSREVFMLDLAGQRQWKQCASMQEGRRNCGVGVLDGKIYVVGGGKNRKALYKCEVYNPMVDAWSSIEDMIPGEWGNEVAAVGGELFVYGRMDVYQGSASGKDAIAYHPVKNEWRQLLHSDTRDRGNPWPYAFVAQGKLHTITPNGIDVYDIDSNSWSALHSFVGFPDRNLNFRDSLVRLGCQILALGDEILMLQRVDNCNGNRLLQSRGFGSKTREIALEEILNCSLSRDRLPFIALEFFMCLIQL